MDIHGSSISLTVPADLACSQLVRQTVKNTLELTPLPACWIYRLMLVVDELFMNAVKYGSARRDAVLVEVQLRRHSVVLRVSDKGLGKMTPQRLGRLVRTNANREGLLHTSGRGLALIAKAWTDRFAIRRSNLGGIMVEAEKSFATAERDVLPATKMHRRSAKHGEELVVHLQEAAFSPESSQEFARLLDTLSDPSHKAICFECTELGHLSHPDFTRLLELYLTVTSKGTRIRWQHLAPSLVNQLKRLQVLDTEKI